MPQREKYAPKKSANAGVTREQLGMTQYPGKLLENYQGEAENRDGSIRTVWFQRIQRQDQQWPDGNLVERLNQPILQWPDGQYAGKGSEADKLAEAYDKALGCDMMPGNTESAKYAGHFFMFRDEPIEGTKFYARMPIEYLGADYSYTGNVRTIQPKDGEAQVAPAADEDNTEGADILAELLNGMAEDVIRTGGARDLVIADAALASYTSILGVSKVGGMTKTANGVLMDRLVDRGFGEIVEGVFVAKVGVPA